MPGQVFALTAPSTMSDIDEIVAATTIYVKNSEAVYTIIISTTEKENNEKEKYTVYCCFTTIKRRRPSGALTTFSGSDSARLLLKFVEMHEEIENKRNTFKIIKEFGDYNKWYNIVKPFVEEQTKLVVSIKCNPNDNSEDSEHKRLNKLRNLIKPKKVNQQTKQIKTLSNSLKEISVIYINSNDYNKQINKVKEILDGKEESVDIVRFDGKGWMGAHHGNKICWLKDFVDYMDFNTFICFIDNYRREFSNHGSHFMNDYSLFIINSFIPIDKLFGSLINEEQRSLLKKRIITVYNMDK